MLHLAPPAPIRLHRHPMRRAYIAIPQHLTSHGWMVFNRIRCLPVASDLTRPQAVTLADALNLAATGELARPSKMTHG